MFSTGVSSSTRQQAAAWLLGTLAAVAAAAIPFAAQRIFPLTPLDKGSHAAYVLRAPQSVAFSLHQSDQDEIREAIARYLPIYDRDDDLLRRKRDDLRRELRMLPVGYWPFARMDDARRPIGPLTPEEALAQAAEEQAGAVERQREVEYLVEGLFGLLEAPYQEGVIADDQFPARERQIRIYEQGRYQVVAVERLRRFSSLKRLLERSAQQFFFKTDEPVRKRLIDFVLTRLPANLRYAKANALFVTDVSQVTGLRAVLLRQGEILARRGQTIDARAQNAIRACLEVEPHPRPRLAATAALLALATWLFLLGMRRLRPRALGRARAVAFVSLLLVLPLAIGQALLLAFPLAPTAIPLLAVAVATAVLMGRTAGLLVALLAVGYGALCGLLDAAAAVALALGGMAGGFATRRRQRGSALLGGAVGGLVAAAAVGASVPLGLQLTGPAGVWDAVQALAGGIGSGVLAVLVLPLGELLCGRCSRARLARLCDFERPLLVELRRGASAAFVHTVSVANLAEAAAIAIEADALLCRAGALYHDIGKLPRPSPQAAEPPTDPATGATVAALEHVLAGVSLLRSRGTPEEVVGLVAEHHGTMPVLATTRTAAAEAPRSAGGEAPTAGLPCFPGPVPSSPEAAVLMLANLVESRAREQGGCQREAGQRLVDDTLAELFARRQLDACGLTPRRLHQAGGALVEQLLREFPHPPVPL